MSGWAECSHCGTRIVSRGAEPAAGRYCMATDCQRARWRAQNALRGQPRPPRPVATPARTAEIRGAVAAISDDDLRALAASRRLAIVPMCAAEPCERPARTKGLCQRHYRRS